MAKLGGAKYFGKPHMLEGYWQYPLAGEAQENFIVSTPACKYTSQRVM